MVLPRGFFGWGWRGGVDVVLNEINLYIPFRRQVARACSLSIIFCFDGWQNLGIATVLVIVQVLVMLQTQQAS